MRMASTHTSDSGALRAIGAPHRAPRWPYGQGVLVVIVCTGIAWILSPYLRAANIVMVYLLGIIIVAMRLGRGASIMTAALSVAAFNFLFLPPVGTFVLRDAEFLLSFAVMLCLSLIVSDRTSRIRAQAAVRAAHASQLQKLASASLAIGSTLSTDEISRMLTEKARDIVGAHVAVTGLNENHKPTISAISLSERYATWQGFDAKLNCSEIYQLVCETNRPMRLTQAELEAHSGGPHLPLRGWLAAPLIAQDGQSLGFIQLSDKYAGEFTEADEAILAELAQTASVGIEKARLYHESERRRRAAEQLYALAHDLTEPRDVDELLQTGIRHVADVFASQVVLYLPDDAGRPVARVSLPIASDTDRGDVTVIESVLVEGKVVLAGGAAYLPFTASRGVRGVLFVRPQPIEGGLTSEQIHLLETFVDRIALAVERIWLAEEARQAEMRVETERLRSSILSSISHDLRTPLAAITSAASSLLEGEELLDPVTRVDLKETIYEEANRLARLVNNLLDMTRLEAGLRARKERQPLEDVVGAALARLERNLQDHPVVARLPEDLPLVPLDAVLIEQVLINLLDNAVKYTPVGSPIEIQISTTASDLTVEVADRGPGLPAGDEERVFEKFYRGIAPGVQGAGLGLAICRGIVLAHGGRMWAQNRAGGGVIFRFALPIESSSPPAEVARG